MLILQNAAYLHTNRDVLFDNIHLAIHKHDKIVLVGNNGTGKSTLLKILAGILPPSGWVCKYYQHAGAPATQVLLLYNAPAIR